MTRLLLPISPVPRLREPVSMFLWRSARYIGMDVDDLIQYLGGPWSARMSFGVDDEVAESLAAAFAGQVDVEGECRAAGLTVEQVREMTLARYAAGLFSDDLTRSYGLPGRALTAGCFQCLRESVWDLTWTTTLIPVCVMHQTNLLWSCPLCDQRFGPDADLPARPSETPTAHGPASRRCIGPQLPRPRADVRDLHASSVMTRLLDAAVTDEDAARQVHDLLRCVRALRDADHAPRTPAGTSPEAPSLHRRDVLIAMDLRGSETRDVVGHPGVRAAVNAYALRGLRPSVVRAAPRWIDRPDPVAAIFHAAHHAQVNERPPLVVPMPGGARDIDWLPAAVPSDLISYDLADLFEGEVDEDTRVSLAVALAQSAGVHPWEASTAELGLSGRASARSRELVRQIEAAGRAEQFWELLYVLRREITTYRITFRDRLDALQHPEPETDRLVTDVARRSGTSVRQVYLRLAQQWACHPPRLLSGPLATRVPMSSALALDDILGSAPWRSELIAVLGAAGAADRRLA